MPFVVVIPFASILADQTEFGQFIYACIIGTVVLLVLLVGVLTLIFNKLLGKYEEERKEKFIM